VVGTHNPSIIGEIVCVSQESFLLEKMDSLDDYPQTLHSLCGRKARDALPELVKLDPPGVAQLGFNFRETTNGTGTGEMVSSAQDVLPELTGVAVQTSSTDVRDEDFLSDGNTAQSIDSEVAGVGVE